jgi:hypothetical protein
MRTHFLMLTLYENWVTPVSFLMRGLCAVNIIANEFIESGNGHGARDSDG